MSRKTRKLMWSVPLVAVFAVVGALAAIGALGIGGVFAHDAPIGPQNLSVEAADGGAGRTTLIVDWDPPASGDATSYRVDVSTNGSIWKFLANTNDTMYSHSGLSADSLRYYRVFAMNSAGTGPVSRDVSIRTKATSEPAQVNLRSATAQSPTQIDLAWSTPDSGGATITRYCIVVHHTNQDPGATAQTDGQVTAACMNNADITDAAGTRTIAADGTGVIIIAAMDDNGDPVTSYMHKGLRAEQRWEYTVYARNMVERSKLASSTRGAKSKDAARPDRPTELTIVQTGADANTIRLYWNGPVSDGGQNIVGYRVEVWNRKGSAPLPPVIETPNASFDASKDNVNPFPDAATDGSRTLVINLPVPTATLQYQMQHSHSSLAGQQLYYRVRTETGDPDDRQTSLWSPWVGKKLADENDYDRIGAPVVTATLQDDNKTGEIKLTFTNVERTKKGETDAEAGFQPSAYRVDVSTDVGVTWQTVQDFTRRINRSEYEHLRVKPGATFTFRVFAWDGSTLGLASNPTPGIAGTVRAPGTVGGPLAVTAPALPAGAGQLDLTWSTPTNNGGGTITRYCISILKVAADGEAIGVAETADIDYPEIDTPSENCGHDMMPTSASMVKAMTTAGTGVIVINAEDDSGAMVTGYQHKGLVAEERWRYRVYAVNSAAPAAQSDTDFGKTGKAGTPGVPQNLIAESAHDSNTTPPGTRGIVLLWTTPTDPPGAPVTGYGVQRLIGETGDFETVHGGSATHWVDKRPPADGDVIAYRVVASNSVGSTAANYAQVKLMVSGTGDDQTLMLVPEHDHEPVAGPEVGPATGVTTGPFNEGGVIQVNWDAAPNATGYIIYAVNVDELDDPDGQIVVEPVNDAAAETINLGGLNVGDTYDIYVVATAKEMVAWPAAAAVQVTAN